MCLTAKGTALFTLSNVGGGNFELLSRESATIFTIGNGAGEGDGLLAAGLGGLDDGLPWLGLRAGGLGGGGRHGCWLGC